jgi:gamma-glutamyltranspeptidase
VDQIRGELGLAQGTNSKIPTLSPLSVTVPGAAAGWVDTVERFGSGKLTMEQILMPAIELAEKGFPVSEFSAKFVGLTKPTRITLTVSSGRITSRLSAMPHRTFVKC